MSLKFFELRNKIIDLFDEAGKELNLEFQSLLYDYIRAEAQERHNLITERIDSGEVTAVTASTSVLKSPEEYNSIAEGLRLQIKDLLTALDYHKSITKQFDSEQNG